MARALPLPLPRTTSAASALRHSGPGAAPGWWWTAAPLAAVALMLLVLMLVTAAPVQAATPAPAASATPEATAHHVSTHAAHHGPALAGPEVQAFDAARADHGGCTGVQACVCVAAVLPAPALQPWAQPAATALQAAAPLPWRAGLRLPPETPPPIARTAG